MSSSAAFEHYLSGYMRAYDLFPDYEIARGGPSGANQLLDDFWNIINDLSQVAYARRATIDRKSVAELVQLEDVEARKKQAARALIRELLKH